MSVRDLGLADCALGRFVEAQGWWSFFNLVVGRLLWGEAIWANPWRQWGTQPQECSENREQAEGRRPHAPSVHSISTDGASNLGRWFGKSVKNAHFLPGVDMKKCPVWLQVRGGRGRLDGRFIGQGALQCKWLDLKSADSSPISPGALSLEGLESSETDLHTSGLNLSLPASESYVLGDPLPAPDPLLWSWLSLRYCIW